MKLYVIGCWLALSFGSLAFAQQKQDSMSSMGMDKSMMKQGNQQNSSSMQGKNQNVPGMRDGGCSPMCQMMMEHEMKAKPWIAAGVSIFGLLVAVALVLLIVLEVQWIGLWSFKIKNLKRQTPQ